LDLVHDVGEVVEGGGVETLEEAAEVGEAGVGDLFGEGAAGGGEFDAADAAVVGVFAAGDEAVADEAVDDAGDGSEADAEVVGEVLAGGGVLEGQEHDDLELAHGEVGVEEGGGGAVLGEESRQVVLEFADPVDQSVAFVVHTHLSLPEKVIRKVVTR
jgi:hypothetical protein